MHPARKVSAHMTRAPHALEAEVTLAEAQRRMRALGLPQLPVLAGGRPCGVLLERDLHTARQLGVDFDHHTVGALVPREFFSVGPDEYFGSVVRTMASRAAPCAVVVEGNEVRGVLTLHDAFQALADLLEEEEAERSRESMVCSLDDESCLLGRAEELAGRILQGQAPGDEQIGELRTVLRELYDTQLARLNTEERTLACTEHDTPLRRSELELRRGEHKRQTQALEGVLMVLDDQTQPPAVAATSLQRALESMRSELERERDPVSYVS